MLPTLAALGDRAVVARFGTDIDAGVSARVLAAWRRIAKARIPGVVDLVPAYATLTVHYDWQALPETARNEPWRWLVETLRELLDDDVADDDASPRRVELPVCYAPPHAPDLADAARAANLPEEEIVRRHAGGDYRVAFLGFRPGFPYLLGLDPALALPRLATPRARVPAGSVGIGGRQTGIYPDAGAGGWRLIGRTPRRLFDPARPVPALLMPGDRVRFRSIDEAEFDALAARETSPMHDDAVAGEAVLDVLAPGIQSSVQDAGRCGRRDLGVAGSGAADRQALALANALVGNAADAAGLELTIRGPDLRTLAPLTIALVGAGMSASANGAALPFGRPIDLPAGTQLSFRALGVGARAWLCIAGGIAAPECLGSAATDFGAGFGGLGHGALRAGDRLHRHAVPNTQREPRTAAASRWWVEWDVELAHPLILRFVADDEAHATLIEALAGQVWRAGAAADRTGCRLEGVPLPAAGRGDRISAGVLHGTIQVPPDGLPILLGPDGQTVGGYPVAGHVVEADLPLLAQLKPGDTVWLEPCSLTEAHHARRASAALLARTCLAIQDRLKTARRTDRR